MSLKTTVVAGLLACGFHASVTAAAPTLQQALAANAALPAAPRLSAAEMSPRPYLRQVKLAPQGKLVAFLEPEAGGLALKLLDTATGERRKLYTIEGTRAELHWSRDGDTLYVDTGATLTSVAVKDGAAVQAAAFDRKAGQGFVSIDQSRPRHALIEETDPATKAYRVLRVDPAGARELVYQGRKLDQFLVGADAQLRFIRYTDDKGANVVAQRAGDEWKALAACSPKQEDCAIAGASADGRRLRMLDGEDRLTLVEVDTANGKRRKLVDDAGATSDMRNVVEMPSTREPLLATYVAPKRHVKGLNAEGKRAAAAIAARFTENNVSVQPSPGGKWLVEESGPRTPQARYWLYDRASGGFTEILAEERAAGKPLAPQQLAQTFPVSYKSSDGAIVHGYVTIPPGKRASGLPLLTMVHGGPWARFDYGYHTLVQTIANRGVAVFQPNFRSSVGHGERYMSAPGNDFGNGRVQADIIEGVRYLVKNGVGDQKRLAIMGDSFGGYSTLLALTHNPDMFQFGMALSPPPEFGSVLKTVAGMMPQEAARLARVGFDLNDARAMASIAATSPAANAARLTRPLVIIAGAKDPMVPVADVTSYVGQLQAAGKPVSFLLDPDEGHMPRKPVVREAYAHLLGALLHRYLGTDAPEAPSAELVAYLAGGAMKSNGALP